MNDAIVSKYPSIPTTAIADVLHRSEASGNRKPPMFLGIYGIGKSFATQAYARAADREYVDYRLAYRTFNDVRGWGTPNRESGRMEWLPDEDLPQDPNGRYALHFEELTNAMPATQKVATELLLERRIGKYELPKDTVVFASGNRLAHKTGVERIMAALADRLAIYHVRPDLDGYMNFLQQNGKSTEVLAYLSSNPSATYDFKVEEWDGEVNMPTFRSFDRLDELVASYADGKEASADPYIKHHATACVGPKHGEQFAQFLKLTSTVGDVGKMIEEADTCRIPNEIDVRWLIACRAIVLATKDNLAQVLLLARRLTDPSLQQSTLQAIESFVGSVIERRKPELLKTRTMIDWNIKHGKALSL